MRLAFNYIRFKSIKSFKSPAPVDNHAFHPLKNSTETPLEKLGKPNRLIVGPWPVAPARAVMLEMSPDGATPLKRKTGALARFLRLLASYCAACRNRRGAAGVVVRCCGRPAGHRVDGGVSENGI